jgi:hypothetical protein
MAPYDRVFIHVEKARGLLQESTDDSLRYAALQARMALEVLFYELIGIHKEELPLDVYERWQPAEVIAALTDCDPGIVRDRTVRIGIENTPGVPSDRPHLEITQKGVTRKLLRDHYHRLGSYLHADMQFRKLDAGKLRSAVEAACASLDHHRATTGQFNVGAFITIECECGVTIKRNQQALLVNPEIRCRNASCGAVFACENVGPGEWSASPVGSAIRCICGLETLVGNHQLVDRHRFKCQSCQQTTELRAGFWLALIDEDSGEGRA